VSCSAKTNGNGGISAPWNSLWAVNTHGAFAPGDEVLFKKGTTCTGKLAPKGSGVLGSPIVFGSYGSGSKPTIAGGGTGMETASITLKNEAYVTLQDLHVTNRGKSSTTTVHRSGVLLLNDRGSYLLGDVVQRLTVDNVTSKLFYSKTHDARDWGGITAHTVNRGRGSGFVALQILNNTVSAVGRTGITTSNREYPAGIDSGLRIAGNTVSKSRGDGIIVRGTSGASIDHNVVKDNSNMWPCPQCMKTAGMGANAGIWVTMSRDSVLEKNNIYGTNVGHGDGEGIDLDIAAERIIVQYNFVHDNDGGGVLFCGSNASTVRFNVFENNKKSAVAFIGSVPAKNSAVYNNTLYAKKSLKAANVRTFNGHHGSGIKFYNNLVYNYGAAVWAFPSKVWARSNTILGVRGNNEPKGTGTSHTDPKLKHPGVGTNSFSSLSGYKPKSASKMQHGIAIPSSVKVDFFGKKVNAKRPPRGAAG
jgi:parallel beta-helix repeat protein